VQLDAVDAGLEAAPRLVDAARVLRLHAAEGAERPVRTGDRVHHEVVGRRVAVGLMHREHQRLGVDRRERLEQLLGRLLEAVGVVLPDVRVGVEERDAGEVLHQAVEPRAEDCVSVEHGAPQ
jgi:hypothetical protein